ncbi:MAG: hypothetical protein ACI8RZ_005539 [Myxococcota bacterium]|jgi:hypothetical protein
MKRYSLRVSLPQQAPKRLDRLHRLQDPFLAATTAGAAAGTGALMVLIIPEILHIGRGIPDVVHLLTFGLLAVALILIQGAMLVVTGILSLGLTALGTTTGILLARRPGPWRVVGVLGAGLCVLVALGGLASLLL